MSRIVAGFRDVLILFLIVLFVVQPAILPLLAQDAQASRPKLTLNPVDYNDPLWYELELQALGLGDTGPSKHSLDLFRLLMQRAALPHARAGVEKAKERIRSAQKGIEKIDSELKALSDDARRENLRKQRAKLEGIEAEARAAKALLRPQVSELKSAISRMDIENLNIVFRDAQGKELGIVYAKDFAAGWNFDAERFENAASFELRFQDTALNYFGSPSTGFPWKVRSALFHDGKLFFIEDGNFNAETGISQISFIDLNYFASAVGRTELPIFRLPVKSEAPIKNLSRRAGELYAGNMAIPMSVVDHVSGFQQTAWNLAVSFADPKSAGSAAEVVNDFTYYFEKSVEMAGADIQEQLSRVVGDENFHGEFKKYLEDQLKARVHIQEARAAAGKAQSDFSREKKEWLNAAKRGAVSQPPPQRTVDVPTFSGMDKKLEATFARMGENTANQRKLLGKLRYLWAKLTLPQPMGAPKLKSALELIRAGILGEFASDGRVAGRAEIGEGLRRLINLRPVKMAGGLFATALFLHMGQDLVGNVLWHFLTSTGDMLSLGWKAFVETVSGVSVSEMYNQYIANGRYNYLAIGGIAAFSLLFMALGVPHFIVNFYKLGVDLRDRFLRESKEAQSAAGAESGPKTFWSRVAALPGQVASAPVKLFKGIKWLKNSFVERQEKEEVDYLNALSSSSYLAEEPNKKFSPEDDEAVRVLLQELKEQQSSWVGRFLGGISKWRVVKMLSASPDSFMGALRHFVFSSASLTHSGSAYAKTWNAWFGFRSFVLHPRLWLTFIYYPNYWGRIFGKMKQKDGAPDEVETVAASVMPSRANGGLRPFYEEEWLRFKGLFNKEAYRNLKAAEQKLTKVEAAIQGVVLRKSFAALLRHIDDPDDLKKFFETNGIDSVTDDTIYALATKNRRFFQMYYWKLQEEATAAFLRRALGSEGDLRNLKEGDLEKLDISDNAAEQVAMAAEVVERVLEDNPHFEGEIAETIELNQKVMESVGINFHMKNFKKLDPASNRQVERMKLAVKQMLNPQAMARAVRATKAAILVDKPLELVMRFVLLAAIDTGIMVPIHEEMFSENSWFHLGRYPFLTGYVVALIQSVLADIWMKIQTDAKNEGTFGEVPEGEDAKLSFVQWYKKQTFYNSKNTWWENQKYNTKLVWANMKAALVTYLVTNILTLGRLDLDTYVTGYLIYFLTPLMGFSMKIEQGFEFASFYYAKDIPKKYRAHPEVEKYLNSRIGMARIWFNLYYKIYENFSGLWLDALQTIATAANGTRAFARILFLGYTPTELVGNALDEVGDALQSIPGAKGCAKALRSVVTNKYTDGSKLTSPP